MTEVDCGKSYCGLRNAKEVDAKIARLQAENERLRADVYEARAAQAVVREIAAAVPLKHTLAATRTGAALVEYVKQAMQKAATVSNS